MDDLHPNGGVSIRVSKLSPLATSINNIPPSDRKRVERSY
jgi:hypothetical protein